jgi:hypothetical protein
MPEKFLSMAEIIKSDPGLAGIRKVIKESDVIINFYKIFPDWEKVVTPKKVEKKVLHLKVENAAWRNELKFKEELILRKVNKFFNDERIKWIKLTA